MATVFMSTLSFDKKLRICDSRKIDRIAREVARAHPLLFRSEKSSQFSVHLYFR